MAPFYQETVDDSGRYVMPKLKSDDIRSIQEIYGPRRGGFRPSTGGSSSGGSSGGRLGSSGGSRWGSGSSGGWGDDDGGFTTERPTTRKHTSLGERLGSWWNRFTGGSRGEREVPSASGSDRDSDSDSGFGGSSPGGDCPSTVDAFTPGFNGNAYLFVGSKVYEMRGNRVVKVHGLRTLFPSGPIFVDAALANPRTESILLFQSGSVYAFHGDRSGKFTLDKSFPKRVPRELGFSPTGAVLWIDGHQILLSRGDDFAVYDEYWNQATLVSTMSSHFPGFPRGIRGGSAEGSALTLFSSSQVYRYDATRKMAIGGATSLRSYLKC